MRALFNYKFTVVWFILTAATALSWWLGTDHALHADQNRLWTTVGLLALAFFKVRLIIQYFMEVRTAPWPLRVISEIYVVGTCAAVITIYALGRHNI
ncbi:MAG: prokaryotic cytochrome oxidase subunit family protein [Nevskia sp.]|nr:prokaryotic cytochrome oxidase subunit family protein [Nevskia sp.]